jgi:dTDP-4-amino-4,6-dideoxygalactose transaminase
LSLATKFNKTEEKKIQMAMEPKPMIPFNKPYVSGKELEYIGTVVKNGKLSGDGEYTLKCNQLIESVLDVPKVMLTTSCTHALEMAAMLLDIEPGDEVIVPSFTFVTTINAFVLRGAIPVFVDIEPDTLNLNANLLESLITSKTKAIVPVHYAGVGCNMEEILKITSKHKIALVEDNAHGLFGRYKDKYLGSYGVLATQSFHETKNFTCGEAGALIINDPNLIERAEIIREKGTDRSRFFRGEVDKYSWIDIGSSYLPAEILAAHLFAQLEKRDEIQRKRKKIWDFYYQSLRSWAEVNEVRLP